jgi:transposase-like protein
MTKANKEERAIIRLEVSVPAARRALQAFAENRIEALESLSRQIRRSVETAFNELMNAEVSLLLGAGDQGDNKRNGYRERRYALKGVGELRLRVPRDRKGVYQSTVIPPYERVDPRLRQDMAIIHLAGLSNRTLAMASQRILGLNVGKDQVSASLDLVKSQAQRWLTRPLDRRYWALFIDGTTFRVQRRGSVEREPMLVVLGIDEDNHRSILAVEPGTRENTDAWRAVFAELKRRGLDAAAVRIGLMDGLSGLERLFADEFPNAVAARCWVHAMKNALAKTPARIREAFKPLATAIMYATSEDDARQAFAALKQTMGDDAQRAVACLNKDREALLAHYRFDRRLWPALKTTNAVERFHKEVKRRTKAMESLGEDALTTIIAFTALRLELGWQKHPVNSKVFDNLDRSPTRQRHLLANNILEGAARELDLVN